MKPFQIQAPRRSLPDAVGAPRPAWRPAARTAAAVVTTVAVALLAAACSGSHATTNAAGSANSTSAVSYSRCMRSHGVPDFPDPPANGAVPKGGAQEFGVSSSRFQAAETACADQLPATGGAIQQCEETGDCPAAVVQQALSLMRRYAQCMRTHGVPKWPDPTIDSEGRPFFNASGAGLSYQYTHSSYFNSRDQECERLVGGSAGVPVPVG